MAKGFRKGVSAALFGEVLALAAVLVWSPKAREAARPYLVRGLRKALELKAELDDMTAEAKLEAAHLVADREVEPASARQH